MILKIIGIIIDVIIIIDMIDFIYIDNKYIHRNEIIIEIHNIIIILNNNTNDGVNIVPIVILIILILLSLLS